MTRVTDNQPEPAPFKMCQASYALLGNVESAVLRQNEGRPLAEMGFLTGIHNLGHPELSGRLGAGQGLLSTSAVEALPILIARFPAPVAPTVSPTFPRGVVPGRPTMLLQDLLEKLLKELDSDDPLVRQRAQAALRDLAREAPEAIEPWLDRKLSAGQRPRLSPEQRNALTMLKADYNLARRTRQLTEWAESHIEEFFDPKRQPGFIYGLLDDFAQLMKTDPRLFSDRPQLPRLRTTMEALLQNLRMRKDTPFSGTEDALKELKEFGETMFDLLRAGNIEHQLGKILTRGEQHSGIDSQQRLRRAVLPSFEEIGDRRATLEEELRAWREPRN